jgi:hypothetical protein
MDILKVRFGSSLMTFILKSSNGKAIATAKQGIEKGFFKILFLNLRKDKNVLAFNLLTNKRIRENHEFMEWVGEFLYWVDDISPQYLPQLEAEDSEVEMEVQKIAK